MKSRLYIFLLFFISWTNARAQAFKWRADLEKVNTNGFYKIAVTPQFLTKTDNTDLSDIRIFEKNKEIAYLIRKIADSMYTAIPTPSVTLKEDKTNQRTIVNISFNERYQINKLILNLEGFRYYRRAAWLTDRNPLITDKKNRYYENRIENFTISSGKQPIIELSGENRYKQLFLIINNEDSEPLSIKNISAYQKNVELITYLEKNKQYIIKMGQINMPFPRYDLSYFNDSISNSVPFIKAVNFKTDKDDVPVKDSTLIKKSWMWIALVLLILFLSYLSYYMVRDMQRKK